MARFCPRKKNSILLKILFYTLALSTISIDIEIQTFQTSGKNKKCIKFLWLETDIMSFVAEFLPFIVLISTKSSLK